MNGNGGFFRNLGYKMKMGLMRFMAGRYGTDKLNMAILGVGLAMTLAAMFIPFAIAKLALTLLAYICMGLAIYRSFSRQTYKRYDENRKFLLFFQKLKDRDHRYFDCPRCRQQVRVPKGKGKISITCPKCKEKFVKKT